MLTEYQQQELARLYRDELDFLYEIASKYNMPPSEVQRMCFFMRIDYAQLRAHTLETKNVH